MIGRRESVRWLAAELVVIVLGILIAYQVESWREARADRARVEASLSTLLSSMEVAAREDSLFAAEAVRRADAASHLLLYLQTPGRTADSTLALFSEAIFRRSYVQSSLPWFRSVQANGTLDLVEDEDLKHGLIGFHDGYLRYISSLEAELVQAEQRFVEASSPDMGPRPGDGITDFGARWYEWSLQRPVEEIPTDPTFFSSLGWVARWSAFNAGRVLNGRERNLALQERLRSYLEGL